MSALSMASLAMANRRLARGDVRQGMVQRAPAVEGQSSTSVDPDTAVTAALKLITSYIPTEILTLYVAGIAIVLTPANAGTTPDYRPAWAMFFSFLALTPMVNWLLYAMKLRAAGQALPVRVSQWPLWEMTVASIAFVFWAAALPTTPFASLGVSQALAGFLVLVVTTLLGLLSSLVRPVSA